MKEGNGRYILPQRFAMVDDLLCDAGDEAKLSCKVAIWCESKVAIDVGRHEVQSALRWRGERRRFGRR